MKRIRYGWVDGMMRSVKNYDHPSNGGSYFVVLDGDKFEIRDANVEGRVVTKGEGKTRILQLNNVRKALAELGIEVEREARNMKGEVA